MERLTKNEEGNVHYFPKCFKSPCLGGGFTSRCDTYDFNYSVCERLGKYEDTGLIPKEIIGLNTFEGSQLKKLLIENTQLKSENAELRSRLEKAVELPCKMEDTVYITLKHKSIVEKKYGDLIVRIRNLPFGDCNDVFFVREEAEKALKERESNE